METLFNADAITRIKKVYPDAAHGLVQLIHATEEHNAGSTEIVLRYDKPEDRQLGKYEVMLVKRVVKRGEA